MEASQERQKELHDGKKSVRQFAVKDLLFAGNFTNMQPKWLPRAVFKITGPLSCVRATKWNDCGGTC